MSLQNEIKIIQKEQNKNIEKLNKLLSKIITNNNTIEEKINLLLNQDSKLPQNIFELLQVTSLHNNNIKGKNVKVAVIDSNFMTIPNKLSYNKIYSPDNNYTESYGHGTQISSIICGQDIGIAPEVDLYACDIGNNSSIVNMTNINKCIRWCIDNSMDIINISLGYINDLLDCSYEEVKKNLISLCNEAYTKKIIIVCAAGNNGYKEDTDTISFPAYLDTVLSIGSVNSEMDLSDFSSVGDSLDFVCLGENIDVYDSLGNVIKKSGTSLSAPVASGIISLLKQQSKSLSQKDIIDILKDNVYDLGIEGKDNYFGYGFMKGCKVPDKYLEDEAKSNFLFRNLNIKPLHDKGIKGKGVKIAIIGYGCAQISDLNIYKYINLTNDGITEWVSAQPPVGDICSSLVASKTLGIAPESDVYILRERSKSGHLLTALESKATEWCLNNDIDIVFTNVNTSPEVLSKLASKGVICVMPCCSQSQYPDSYKSDPNALKVTFITPEKEFISSSSNKYEIPYQSEYVDCAAYGFGFEYINSSSNIVTHTESEYPGAIWRTMFASYEVIGILALLKQQNPEINTAEKVRKLLPELCDNLGKEKNNQTGYGLLKAKILD